MEYIKLDHLSAWIYQETQLTLPLCSSGFYHKALNQWQDKRTQAHFYMVLDWSHVEMFSRERVLSWVRQAVTLKEKGAMLVIKATRSACVVLKAMSLGFPVVIVDAMETVGTNVDSDEKEFLWGV